MSDETHETYVPRRVRDMGETPKRKISTVTGYALGGYTVGTAISAILVWLLAQGNVDATEIEQPLGYVIQAAGVAFGGWAAPPHEQVGN